MDRVSNAILEKISSLASIGRYVIIAEDEFFECFPDGCEKSGTELKKALKNLINAEYIDMKYSNGNMYCVAPVKRYVPELTVTEPKRDDPPAVKKAFNANPFWAAFAGGALGSLIISLLFALIGYAG